MKSKLRFALLLIGVFTLGVLSVRAWDKYKVEERIRVQAAQIESDARAKADEMARAEAEAQSKAKFAKECEAGQVAFDALSTSEQKKLERPVCDLDQVE